MKSRENKTNAELIKKIEVLQEKVNKLEKAEDQFRIIAENTSDVITLQTFDLKSSYTYVSPSVKALAGYEPEELLGKSCFDIIHPEDKKVLSPLLKKYIDYKLKYLITGKEPAFNETIELRIKNKSDKWIYVQSTANVMGNQLLFVTRDITERMRVEKKLQESEEKFRNIIASAQDTIIIIDNNGNISDWNEAAEKMFGHTKEEAIGKKVHKFIVPAKYYSDFSKEFEVFRKTGKGPAIGKTIELTGLRKDGNEFPVEISLSVLKLKGKWNVTSIIRDITERKKAEEQLKKTNEELSAFDRLAVGRELKMIELKSEINEFLKKMGQEGKYKIVE